MELKIKLENAEIVAYKNTKGKSFSLSTKHSLFFMKGDDWLKLHQHVSKGKLHVDLIITDEDGKKIHECSFYSKLTAINQAGSAGKENFVLSQVIPLEDLTPDDLMQICGAEKESSLSMEMAFLTEDGHVDEQALPGFNQSEADTAQN